MNWWTNADGAALTGDVKENDFENHLPKGSYKSIIEEAAWNEWRGVRTINLKVRVIDGAHKNRLSFLKLKCEDDDDSKRSRARNLLMQCAIVLGVSAPKSEPDDEWLSKLTDKPVMISLGAFTFHTDEGESKTINFLTKSEAIGKPVKPAAKPAARKPAPVVEDAGEQEEYAPDLTDEDVPF